MPFLFVFPNQSPSRAPMAALGRCSERRALSQSRLGPRRPWTSPPGHRTAELRGSQAQRQKKLYLFIGPFEVCVAVSENWSTGQPQKETFLSRARLGQRTRGCGTWAGLGEAGAHSGPQVSPGGQGSVSCRRHWQDPFQGWLGCWDGGPAWPLGLGIALRLPVPTPLSSPRVPRCLSL